MTRRVVEKLCTKKVCVDFLAPKKNQGKEGHGFAPNRFPGRELSAFHSAYGGEISYLNSCRSRFSGVYLVFEVFQLAWCSNKENPSAFWNATLSCPFICVPKQTHGVFRRTH